MYVRPVSTPETADIAARSARELLATARQAQSHWADVPLKQRVKLIGSVRHVIAEHAHSLAASIERPDRSLADSLSAEVMPLAESARFIEKYGYRILRTARPIGRRPLWLAGISLKIQRDPRGVVFVIAPSNYPLMLPGIQVLQALAAGNAVILKPAPGCLEAARKLQAIIEIAGLPEKLITIIDEGIETAQQLLELGPDHVVLTGSARTGQAVMRQLAETITPATMELSGCDAMIILDEADLDLVTSSIAWGLSFNSSHTCIAPRRVILPRRQQAELEKRLIAWAGGEQVQRGGGKNLHLHDPRQARLNEHTRDQLIRLLDDAIRHGARLIVGSKPESATEQIGPLILSDVTRKMQIADADIFAPLSMLIAVEDVAEAEQLVKTSRYRLGASVYGPTNAARDLATRLDVGCVTVNDLIMPTADPRLPFGGRGGSGFGVTRGAEGLLEMTQVKAVATRHRGPRPHLDPAAESDEAMFTEFITASHGRHLMQRIKSCVKAIRLAMKRPR